MDITEKKEIEENIEQPLDNFQIKEVLPFARIITNQDLNKCENIDEVFDNSKFADFIILLYLDGKDKGHWTALTRYGDIQKPQETYIEFFDSYGGSMKKVHSYCPLAMRKELGTEKDKLTELLNKCPYNVIYNPIEYQKVKNGVNTCGRHCAYRIRNLIEKGRTLSEYYDYMKYLKAKEGLSYDEIVAKNVDV